MPLYQSTVNAASEEFRRNREDMLRCIDQMRRKLTQQIAALHALQRWNLVSGVRATQWDLDETSAYVTTLPGLPAPVEVTTAREYRDRQVSLYTYAHHRVIDKLILTFGASIDELRTDDLTVQDTNPKLGLTWHPLTDTYLRIAAFRTLQGKRISKQLTQPTLEPMQVAGFNQYFFDSEGERARVIAAGIDHALTERLRIGASHFERQLEKPFYVITPGTGQLAVDYLHARESMDEMKLYWAPGTNLALELGWEREDFDYIGQTSTYSFNRLQTDRVPIEMTLFRGRWLSFRLKSTRIHQNGVFFTAVPTPSIVPGDSRFWVHDASVRLQLPNRMGTFELGIRNLLDNEFNFQDTDPENPRVFPER